jgi:hypothetical protein
MTKVTTPTRDELVKRREAILSSSGLTADELATKVVAGRLVGDEWSVWAEIEEIDYLLDGV